jgi:inorganic pyrophosphatase
MCSETAINEGLLETQQKREAEMIRVSGIIAEGAKTFLFQEYVYLSVFMIGFAILLALVAEYRLGTFWTTCAFLTGFTTSILSGYIGMRIAVIANVRTTKESSISLHRGFVTAFRGGAVLGFVLVGFGLLNLQILILIYRNWMYTINSNGDVEVDYYKVFDAIAGYGLGGSSMALFGRVGGGIYTKCADVGSDLVGKVVAGLEEDLF